MVTERSASSEVEEQPSILAQLRAWSAKHPLRPADGSPPALCDPDEIPIVWARRSERFSRTVLDRSELKWALHALRRIKDGWQEPHRDPDAESAATTAVVDAILGLQSAVASQSASHAGDSSAAVELPAIQDALQACYQASLLTSPDTFRSLAEQLPKHAIKVSVGKWLARWLLAHARHGEAIELAIGLLRLAGDRDRCDDLYALGRHPHLWSSAANALHRLDKPAEDLVWARLAQAGCCNRRDLLWQVAPMLADRPDIREWIIRNGHSSWPGDPLVRDDVRASDGKLADVPFAPCVAAACAVAGDLAGALAQTDIDESLLDAACEIVADLFGDMGEDDIETCPDGVLMFQQMLRQLSDRCDSLTRLRLVQQIHAWLEWPPEGDELDADVEATDASDQERPAGRNSTWQRREARGWTEMIRADLAADCQRILRRPHWPDRIRAAFATYEPYSPAAPARGREGHTAWVLARSIGVDLWEDGLRVFKRYPLDGYLASRLLESQDDARVEHVVRLAEHVVPRAWQERLTQQTESRLPVPRDSSLILLVQAMARRPVYSERLVALALRVPDLRSRAGRVLEQRPPATWGDEVIAALRDAAAEESHEQTRTHLVSLLARLEEPRWRAPSS